MEHESNRPEIAVVRNHAFQIGNRRTTVLATVWDLMP